MKALPDFAVACVADGKPAPGIPILVRVAMREKNDYHFVAGLTDSEGRPDVDGDDVEREVGASRRVFPSDYQPLDGPQGAFAGVVSVHAMNVTEVEAALRVHDLYGVSGGYPKNHRSDLEAGYRRLLALSPRRIDVEVTGVTDGVLSTKITTGSLAFPAMASAH